MDGHHMMTDRQLTAAVKNATTPERLAQLAAAHSAGLNPIHIAAILTKLANITKKGPNHFQPVNSSRHVGVYSNCTHQMRTQLLQQLMGNLIAQQCEGHSPRGLANIIWALAKLQANPEPQLLDMLLTRFCQQLALAVPQDIANVLWGVAQTTKDHSAGEQQQLSKQAASSDLFGSMTAASSGPGTPMTAAATAHDSAATCTTCEHVSQSPTVAGAVLDAAVQGVGAGASAVVLQADADSSSDLAADAAGASAVEVSRSVHGAAPSTDLQEQRALDKQPLLSAQQVHALLQQLCTMLPLAASQTISNIAWAVTVLQQYHGWCMCPCIPYMQQLMGAFSTHLHDAQPGHVQRVMRCVTQLSTACAGHNALAWIEWQPMPLALLLQYLVTQRCLLKQYHVASVLKDVALIGSLFIPFDKAAANGAADIAGSASGPAGLAAEAAAAVQAVSESMEVMPFAGSEDEQDQDEAEAPVEILPAGHLPGSPTRTLVAVITSKIFQRVTSAAATMPGSAAEDDALQLPQAPVKVNVQQAEVNQLEGPLTPTTALVRRLVQDIFARVVQTASSAPCGISAVALTRVIPQLERLGLASQFLTLHRLFSGDAAADATGLPGHASGAAAIRLDGRPGVVQRHIRAPPVAHRGATAGSVYVQGMMHPMYRPPSLRPHPMVILPAPQGLYPAHMHRGPAPMQGGTFMGIVGASQQGMPPNVRPESGAPTMPLGRVAPQRPAGFPAHRSPHAPGSHQISMQAAGSSSSGWPRGMSWPAGVGSADLTALQPLPPPPVRSEDRPAPPRSKSFNHQHHQQHHQQQQRAPMAPSMLGQQRGQAVGPPSLFAHVPAPPQAAVPSSGMGDAHAGRQHGQRPTPEYAFAQQQQQHPSVSLSQVQLGLSGIGSDPTNPQGPSVSTAGTSMHGDFSSHVGLQTADSGYSPFESAVSAALAAQGTLASGGQLHSEAEAPNAEASHSSIPRSSETASSCQPADAPVVSGASTCTSTMLTPSINSLSVMSSAHTLLSSTSGMSEPCQQMPLQRSALTASAAAPGASAYSVTQVLGSVGGTDAAQRPPGSLMSPQQLLGQWTSPRSSTLFAAPANEGGQGTMLNHSQHPQQLGPQVLPTHSTDPAQLQLQQDLLQQQVAPGMHRTMDGGNDSRASGHLTGLQPSVGMRHVPVSAGMTGPAAAPGSQNPAVPGSLNPRGPSPISGTPMLNDLMSLQQGQPASLTPDLNAGMLPSHSLPSGYWPGNSSAMNAPPAQLLPQQLQQQHPQVLQVQQQSMYAQHGSSITQTPVNYQTLENGAVIQAAAAAGQPPPPPLGSSQQSAQGWVVVDSAGTQQLPYAWPREQQSGMFHATSLGPTQLQQQPFYPAQLQQQQLQSQLLLRPALGQAVPAMHASSVNLTGTYDTQQHVQPVQTPQQQQQQVLLPLMQHSQLSLMPAQAPMQQAQAGEPMFAAGAAVASNVVYVPDGVRYNTSQDPNTAQTVTYFQQPQQQMFETSAGIPDLTGLAAGQMGLFMPAAAPGTPFRSTVMPGLQHHDAMGQTAPNYVNTALQQMGGGTPGTVQYVQATGEAQQGYFLPGSGATPAGGSLNMLTSINNMMPQTLGVHQQQTVGVHQQQQQQVYFAVPPGI